MTNNTANRTAATMYAQIDLVDCETIEGNSIITDPLPDWRSDALYSPEQWRVIIDKLIDTQVGPDARKGRSYEIDLYITPEREADRDTGVSFRESLALAHSGIITFNEFGQITEFTLSERPEISEYGSVTFPMTDEALASWSTDMTDMFSAYDAGADADHLITAFLRDHGAPVD